jgi:hypothetical protein
MIEANVKPNAVRTQSVKAACLAGDQELLTSEKYHQRRGVDYCLCEEACVVAICTARDEAEVHYCGFDTTRWCRMFTMFGTRSLTCASSVEQEESGESLNRLRWTLEKEDMRPRDVCVGRDERANRRPRTLEISKEGDHAGMSRCGVCEVHALNISACQGCLFLGYIWQ